MRAAQISGSNRWPRPAEDATTLISHEWIERTGGAEEVFGQLLATFPGARAACLWNDDPVRFPAVDETWLARSDLRRKKVLALPLTPPALASLDLEGVDRVISSSHGFGHWLAARAARSGRLGYAYIHTPARYIWNPELDARGNSLLARIGRRPLRALDRRWTDRRVEYAANSNFVRERIRKVWDLDAAVIHPPVAVSRIQSVADWRTKLEATEVDELEKLPSDFVLGASRMVGYKRLGLVIEVGESLGLPVVLAGSGPERAALEERASEASVPVHFVGRVRDEMLYALYQCASLYVFPPVEDFGIMPVECVAAGTPVLVNRVGGAAESTRQLGAGAVAEFASADETRLAAEAAMRADMVAAVSAASAFSAEAFRARIREWTKSDGGNGCA